MLSSLGITPKIEFDSAVSWSRRSFDNQPWSPIQTSNVFVRPMNPFRENDDPRRGSQEYAISSDDEKGIVTGK